MIRELLVMVLLGGAIFAIGAVIWWVIRVENVKKGMPSDQGWFGIKKVDEYQETYGDKDPW